MLFILMRPSGKSSGQTQDEKYSPGRGQGQPDPFGIIQLLTVVRWYRMGMKRAARWRAVTVSVGAVTLAAGVAACGSGGGSSSPVAASAAQTIVFAESGLGTEGTQTQAAINGFEKANPNIKVQVQVLSSDSTTYLSQLEHDFISGSSTPDVFESDVTYPAKFAQAGWVLPLTQFKPDTGQFFKTEVDA